MTAQRRHNLCPKPIKKRMRPWLIDLIESHSIPGLVWIDKAQSIFRVPWKHGSRQNWKQEDANLFILWAQHRGKYVPDEDGIPNTKKFKATFRCALNSLPDCVEIVENSRKSGHDAFKIYKFNECEKRKPHKIQQKERKEDSDEQLSTDSFTPDQRLLLDTSSNETIPRLDELFGDLRTSFPNGGIYFLQEDVSVINENMTAHNILEKIENSYTEEPTEMYLEEMNPPYIEEVTIQCL